MSFTELKRKFLAVGAFVVLTAAGLAVLPGKTHAAEVMDGTFVLSNSDTDTQFVVTKTPSQFMTFGDHALLMRQQVMNGRWRITLVPVNEAVANTQVILTDMTNPANQITLGNTLTGPGSTNINVVRFSVSREFFMRTVSNLSSGGNMPIRVNTGGNVVADNTLTGNLSSGNVTISMQ